jgi:threonyl-tRNA synthetase
MTGLCYERFSMTISVILPDGKALALADGATALDAARTISPRLAAAVVVADVDGEIRDLAAPLHDGAKLKLLGPDTPAGRDAINHSAEHILAMAVIGRFPGAQVTMGPRTHGEEFYYDFDLGGRVISSDDLEAIEADMRKLIAEKTAFSREVVPKPEVLPLLESLGQGNPYKAEILSWIPEDDVSIYRSGGFADVCRGPHLPNASFIGGVKLTAASAAYWRADSSKQSLQRVRGVAFPTAKELERYVHQREEAKRRDHRKLGKDLELFLVSERYDEHAYVESDGLDLYVGVDADAPIDRALVADVLAAVTAAVPDQPLRKTVKLAAAPAGGKPHADIRLRGQISAEVRKSLTEGFAARKDADIAFIVEPHYVEEVGAGLVMWLPKGGRLRAIIEEQWRKMHFEAGYDLVYSPNIAKADLWKTSGHWDFYRDSMFSPMSVDGHDYCCKPMNCPFHVLMVKSRPRSYRELPMRLAELGTVYRYEAAGVLHGLMRVRGFTQDDAHLFCRADQIDDEISRVLSFILRMLRMFGFKDFEINLSTRPEKYVGSLEDWQRAETALANALDLQNLAYVVDAGGGAFYGPKIDIKLVDALDRSWQCSTLQYDFNNPARFGLEFRNSKGEREQPIMLHRALLGSIERFIGILLEHYAGALPAWLAPEQVRVLAVSNQHEDHAARITRLLERQGFRVGHTPSNEKLGAKIRDAQLSKIPLMLVIGDKEVAADGAAVRTRDGKDHGLMASDALVAFIREQCVVPDPGAAATAS